MQKLTQSLLEDIDNQFAIIIDNYYKKIRVIQFSNVFTFIEEIVNERAENSITIYRIQLFPPTPEDLERIHASLFE